MCCSRVHSFESDRLHSTQVHRPSWFMEPFPLSIISRALGVRGLPGTHTFFLLPFLADMVLGVFGVADETGVVGSPPATVTCSGGLRAPADMTPATMDGSGIEIYDIVKKSELVLACCLNIFT